MNNERYNFSFEHGIRVVRFYDKEDETEAKEAFQARFGYWPEDNVWIERYFPEDK